MATQLQPPQRELLPQEQEELPDLHSSDLHSEEEHASIKLDLPLFL